MAVDQVVETSDADLQIRKYNESGSMVRRNTYSPAADTHWCVVGLVLADAVTVDDVPTLVTAIEALSGVTAVASPQVWGQTPSSILANTGTPTYEVRVVSATRLTCQIGYGADLRRYAETQYEEIKPPLNKKWLIVSMTVPSALDQTGIAALEAALEGLTGITAAEHLVGGTVPANATDISLAIESRMRIDPIES